MARVFISYRRADGRYAPGWIMERLGRIAGGTEIRTAFTDSDLKFGDDFPARLTKEINEADVVIVVIGPHWHGFAEDGAARIRDPEDWVGREVTMALIDKYGRNKTSGGEGKGDEKLIVPVMVTGSEPLRAADLLPEHHKLPELNWVQFDDEADLDRLAEEVAKHLGCLDEARDRVEGLNERITSTPWRPTWSTLLAVVAAAVAGGLAGWFLGEDTSTSDEIGAMQTAWWAGACVVGVVYTRSSLERSIRVDWKIGFQTTAIAVILVALTVTSFAAAEERNVLATLLQAFAGVALLSPWIFAMVGPGWSQTIATSLKGRAEVIAKQRRVLVVSTAVIASALALAVAASATVASSSAEGNPSIPSLVSFGAFLSLILLGGLEYSHSKLRHESDLLEIDAKPLGVTPRENVHAAHGPRSAGHGAVACAVGQRADTHRRCHRRCLGDLSRAVTLCQARRDRGCSLVRDAFAARRRTRRQSACRRALDGCTRGASFGCFGY